MPIDEDMMPEAPAEEVAAGAAAEVDVALDGSLFDAVPNMGDPIPPGTYHFRLSGYTVDFNKPKEGEDPWGFGNQPYFLISWVCQQEPLTGRQFREFCPYVNTATAQACAGPKDHPKTQAARLILNDRLWKAKAILEAAGLKPGSGFDFKAFLNDHPEVKITTGLKTKKEKSTVVNAETGKEETKYIDTTEKDTKVIKYLPLRSPAHA